MNIDRKKVRDADGVTILFMEKIWVDIRFTNLTSFAKCI